MNIRIGLIIALIAFVLVAGVLAAEETFPDLKAKRSYCVGLDIGQNLKDGMFDLEIERVLEGIRDVYGDKEKKVSEEELVQTLTEYQQELQKQHNEMQQKLSEKNLADGKAFMEENAKKEGVVVTASGLQYKVLQTGSGATPGPTDKVEVHYRGTLIDGSEFDSSYTRGEPVTFSVNQVIPGWTEAVQLMKEGAKYQVVIPADLAYGPRGAGQAIGPNSTLVFDIELLKVNPEEELNP
ncbi:FKBP-type peptidyl-prolyl cis-trans isomerase [bacterium]|nr:FKBP-type peptidyl-prolyl cis-trans isomerase [candidate division CSSED10-310 bacterium]